MPKLRDARAPNDQPDHRGDHDREHERQGRVPPEHESFGFPARPALCDHVSEHVSGDAHEGRLRKRDHAAVGGEEDQAGCGNPE